MLSLVEDVLLLTLDSERGSFLEVPEYSMELALGGAVLMELALQDRIDSDLDHLQVVDPTPTGDPVLDPILATLAGTRGAKSIRKCLMWLARQERIRKDSLERLVERGILERRDRKFLWAFSSTRYPVVDETQKREVKARILALLFSEEIPAPRDVVLICLANACSLFASILRADELRLVTPRIERISHMDLIGRNMLIELRELLDSVRMVGWWGLGQASDPDLAADPGAGGA